MNLLSIIYYFGITSCGIQGSEKSRQKNTFFCFPASFLASLGGGMFRDLFILSVFPVALTKKCTLDIAIALCAGVFYRILSQKHLLPHTFNYFVTITDSLGLGTFIAIGINRALDLGYSQDIAFYCGVITALGGGILSSLFCGRSIHEILTTDMVYQIITVMGAFFYLYCLANNVNRTTAQYWLILYTFSFVPISNCDSKVISIRHLKSMLQYPIIAVACIPTENILYRQSSYCIYIPHQTSLFPFSASVHTHNKHITNLKNSDAMLNPKFRCPRRFSRGR